MHEKSTYLIYTWQRYLNILYFLSFLALLLAGCAKQPKQSNANVYIESKDGKFTLYKNGSPYLVKGASGYTHLDVLKKAGGNTIRTWDTAMLGSILKDANENGLAVIVGLPIPASRYLTIYNDPLKTDFLYNSLKTIIDKYKNEPALLMWCVGNELSFPYKPTYKNFYTSFNNIVSYIHNTDPNHPVTTTIANFLRKDIFNIKHKTNIDVISFNLFGKLNTFEKDLKAFSSFWNGPYLITEWAIDGPWEGTPQTAWQAYIEPTSTQKAEQYLLRYQTSMPQNDGRYLGSCIFFWGQKQETTHTWFSLFDEFGNKTEAVTMAEEIWTSNKSQDNFPRINYMLLDGKRADDNIIYMPNQPATAVILMEKGSEHPTKIEWEIYPEDWYRKDKIDNLVKPAIVKTVFRNAKDLQVSFDTPLKEGPYRIFVKVFSGNGNIATCNTPFYVTGTYE